ncbi:hypothetical protein HDU87_006299 [Geranomyces variabilis]|uniref:Protein kinase domain-containing protein n=1 Tax=Geranomyces variabilis TaxID=109894 RepID=A0AAD5TGY1_9FUNG|nr:hypothetical protein HDU87_006299 [Geranomyces variabilis]
MHNSPPQPGRKPSLVERASNAIEAKLGNTGLRRVSTTPNTPAGGSSHGLSDRNASSASLGVPFFTAMSASTSASSLRDSNSPYHQQNIPDPVQQDPLSMNVDDYQMGEPIGYGSSAVVYIALYKPTNIKVAIKMIDLDMFERNQIDELRREIQIMSLSKHPNLLPVYGSFVNGSKLLIVTPFLSSGSCLDIMKTAFQDGMDEVSIATILRQALEGLAYLHKNGLIHRDVKAGNLLIHEDGLVQLADFGVSSSLMDTGERRGLRKTFVGTPCWMAPEVMEQSGYDYKADIWSFGITALELATGHAPFAKYPPLKVLMMTLQSDPPTLDRDATKHKYSKLFKEMIDMCLVKDPARRPNAEKLLGHPFFKQAAKKRSYLVSALLAKLPPITQRAHNRRGSRTEKGDSYAKGVSWDFTAAAEEMDEFIQKQHEKDDGRKGVSFAPTVEGGSGTGAGAGTGSAVGVPIKKSRFTVGGSPVVSPNVSSLALAIDNSNAASPVGTPVTSAAISGAPAAATTQYEEGGAAGSTPADAASLLQGPFNPSLQSDPAAGTPPTTPASANASGPGEVRKGRFSVNQSSSSSAPSSNNQPSPGSSAASIVNESARQTNSPVEAGRDNEPPLERKPSRFAVQSFPGGAAAPSTTPGPPASGAAGTPATASSAQSQQAQQQQQQQQQQQPTPTAGELRESTLPRSNSDRRGRFEVTTSEKPPLAPATPPLPQQQSTAAVHEVHGAVTATQSQLIETLQGLLESQRAVFADVSAALAQRGLSFEQLGVHVPHEAFAPLPPVHLVPEQQPQSEPSQQQHEQPQPQHPGGAVGAIPVGGLAWVKRENDVLRKDLEATKAKLSAATAAGAGYPPPPSS